MTNAPDSETPGTVPSKPGVMVVMSKALHPDSLNPLDFCDWYENTHIQEVQMTGGISRTQRYASFSFIGRYQQDASSGSRTAENQNCKYDFITVYHMQDLAFRESAAFRGLAGQSIPSDDLAEKIFKQAEFCTRFCEELRTSPGVPLTTSNNPSSPSPFLVTIGVPSNRPVAGVLLAVSRLAGKQAMTAYKVHEASILSEFKRSYVNEPKDMLLVVLDSKPEAESLGMGLQEQEGLEVGVWGLRREYDGGERTPAPWRPV
jgi:hypothetical protein